MMNRTKILLSLLLCGISFTSCYRVPDKLEPQINYVVQDKYIRSLQTCFTPLDKHELQQEWGKEYFIGIAFSKKLDLYRAVTAFKRAEILIPDQLYHRKQVNEHVRECCFTHFDASDNCNSGEEQKEGYHPVDEEFFR